MIESSHQRCLKVKIRRQGRVSKWRTGFLDEFGHPEQPVSQARSACKMAGQHQTFYMSNVLSIRFLNNWVNTGFVASLILKSKNVIIETIRSVNHRMFWAPLLTDKEGELENNEDDPLPAIL